MSSPGRATRASRRSMSSSPGDERLPSPTWHGTRLARPWNRERALSLLLGGEHGAGSPRRRPAYESPRVFSSLQNSSVLLCFSDMSRRAEAISLRNTWRRSCVRPPRRVRSGSRCEPSRHHAGSEGRTASSRTGRARSSTRWGVQVATTGAFIGSLCHERPTRSRETERERGAARGLAVRRSSEPANARKGLGVTPAHEASAEGARAWSERKSKKAASSSRGERQGGVRKEKNQTTMAAGCFKSSAATK